MSEPLTEETFRRGMERLREMGERADREHAERVREVAARGRRKSRLGQFLDRAYINRGTMVMSPQQHATLTAVLAAEEGRAERGEEQSLSEDTARSLELAAWSGR